MNFDIGETISCYIEVKDDDGILTDPKTSMKISIYDPAYDIVVNEQDMIKDETGKYHYDYNSPSNASRGKYTIKCTSVEGSRITIEKDFFVLE